MVVDIGVLVYAVVIAVLVLTGFVVHPTGIDERAQPIESLALNVVLSGARGSSRRRRAQSYPPRARDQ
jgi:hypothetical protein